MKENELLLFAGLKERDLLREGLLIGEGRFVVERMLSSGLPMLALLCTPSLQEYFSRLVKGRCPVHVLPEGKISGIAGFPFHRGVLAAARRPELPSLREYLASPSAEVCSESTRHPVDFREHVSGPGEEASPVGKQEGRAASERRKLLVLCPDVKEPENLGGIIRSAAAFGAEAVVCGRGSADPFSRKAVRASMATVFRLPLLYAESPDADCRALHERGYRIAAAALSEHAVELADFSAEDRTNLVLLLGNEAFGVDAAWEERCDVLLTIPMQEGVDSLNVGVAAGILLYELLGRGRKA